MELLEGKTLSRLLIERYSHNPRHWSFTVSPSPHARGFFDGIFANQDEVWQIKFDSIFKPEPIMLGTQLDADPVKFSNNLSLAPYGYRKLEPATILGLLQKLAVEEGDSTVRSSNARSLDSVLRSLETVVPEAGASYAEGPFVITRESTKIVSEAQRSVDARLAAELRNILKSRFQGYG